MSVTGINASLGAVTANTAAFAAAPLAAPPSSNPAALAVLPPGATVASSPRVVIDTSAGIVLQFLNGDGSFQSQVPSSTVVAYLRAGLTPEGLSKPPVLGLSSGKIA